MAHGERRKKAFKILIIPFSLLCFFIYLYFSVGLDAIGGVFSRVNYKYFALAFGVQYFAYILEHLRFYISRRHYQKKVPYWYESHAMFSSNFWELLTPGTFAFGPVNHVAIMNKQGVPPSKGATIILYNGICWFTGLVIATIAFTALNFKLYIVGVRWYLVVFYCIGLIVNIATIFVYAFVPRHAHFVEGLVKGVLNILRKLHVIRKEERYKSLLIKSEDQIRRLKKNISELSYRPYEWIITTLLCMTQLFVSTSVYYFLALSLGVTGVDVFKIVGAFLIINNITIIFPIPGGLGVYDLALQLVLYPLFALSAVDVAYSVDFLMIFGRIVTYYFPLLLGAIALTVKAPTIKNGKCSICEGYTIIENTANKKEGKENEQEGQEEAEENKERTGEEMMKTKEENELDEINNKKEIDDN